MEDLSDMIPLPGEQEDRTGPPPGLPDEPPEPELPGQPEEQRFGMPARPVIRLGQWNNL